MRTAAILIVGDEILEGHTQDTNSHYLANRLRARGVAVRRIVTVGDEVDPVARELETLLHGGFDFIFVCGGIGPTPDDRTYEAVAVAVAAPLVLLPEDEAWMRRRVEERRYGTGLLEDPAQAEALWRMVRRPEGSQAIANPVGAALGSAIHVGATWAFVLPGVPRELRAMMEEVVEPTYLLPEAGATIAELEWVGEEARLWPLLRDVEALCPGARLGSYPQDDKGRIVLRVQGPTADVEGAVARLVAGLQGKARRLK